MLSVAHLKQERVMSFRLTPLPYVDGLCLPCALLVVGVGGRYSAWKLGSLGHGLRGNNIRGNRRTFLKAWEDRALERNKASSKAASSGVDLRHIRYMMLGR